MSETQSEWKPWAVYTCQHVGVAGTTKVHVRHVQVGKPARGVIDVFEARVGIAILGQCNPETTEDSDPFSRRFRDNFARGLGTTPEMAIEALRADMQDTAASLWAV
jgi:hypothetical protein